jgi:hypothetical protein
MTPGILTALPSLMEYRDWATGASGPLTLTTRSRRSATVTQSGPRPPASRTLAIARASNRWLGSS